MISRREFLAAPLAVASTAALISAVPKPGGVKIGCQTNAWRIDPNNFDSLLAVLGKLKELGYEGYETGFRNVQGQFENAATARKQLEKFGLKFLGCHIFLDEYDPETRIPPLELIKKVAAGAAKLGGQRVIVSGKGVTGKGPDGGDSLSTALLFPKIFGLREAASYCSSLGLRLAYHNHAPEFALGGLELNELIDATSQSRLDFLIDCGWAFQAKVNVPEFFAKHHKRIIGLHLRDFKDGQQVPLGQGEFPIRELAAAIKKANWTGWVINEEERLSGEKPGEKAVAPARQTLKQAFGK